jgi:hypothetical protein
MDFDVRFADHSELHGTECCTLLPPLLLLLLLVSIRIQHLKSCG